MTPSAAQSGSGQVQGEVRGWPLGPFETNCYLVTAPGTDGCWVVDPGLGPLQVIDAIREGNLRPEAIVLTHAHLDHVAGIPEVRRAFPQIPIVGHIAERDWPADPNLNLSASYGIPIGVPGATQFVGEGDILELGQDRWRVLHTPGHSPGSISLVNDRTHEAIVGDTLFAGSVGRSDFPGSNEETLYQVIRQKLYTLPDSMVVYPGHGPTTTIGREKRSNAFVRA